MSETILTVVLIMFVVFVVGISVAVFGWWLFLLLKDKKGASSFGVVSYMALYCCLVIALGSFFANCFFGTLKERKTRFIIIVAGLLMVFFVKKLKTYLQTASFML